MPRYTSPGSQEGSLSTAEMAEMAPLDSCDLGSSTDAGSEYLTPFHLYTSTISPPVPSARLKRKSNDSADNNDQANNDQAKRQRTIIPVATADGNVPLKKTWEMTELKDRKGLLSKF